jgi:hypothetical protein
MSGIAATAVFVIPVARVDQRIVHTSPRFRAIFGPQTDSYDHNPNFGHTNIDRLNFKPG